MSASRKVTILVVSPHGSIRLACVDGRPVVRIEVVEDACATLAALGGGFATRDGRPVAVCRPGDRRSAAWREHRVAGSVAGRAPGVTVVDGRITVELPFGVDLADFRARLLWDLRSIARLGVSDAVVDPARERLHLAQGGWLGIAHPLRLPVGMVNEPRSFLLDLGREAWLLYWIAASARLTSSVPDAS